MWPVKCINFSQTDLRADFLAALIKADDRSSRCAALSGRRHMIRASMLRNPAAVVLMLAIVAFLAGSGPSAWPQSAAAVLPDRVVAIHYSPTENLERIDVAMIDRAEHSIDLAAYVLTDWPVRISRARRWSAGLLKSRRAWRGI